MGDLRGSKVLVVGATGLLGRPVARRLRDDGHAVRVLVRDIEAARQRLGDGIEYVPGSVTDARAVETAVAGCDAVHVSLGASGRADLDAVERGGTTLVAGAARRHGLARISYLTGSLVHEDVRGPEPMTLREALQPYCALVAPGTRGVTVPRAVMSVVDRVAMGGRLRSGLEIMTLLARLGERGDAAPTTEGLGAATTTVRAWCEARSARGGVAR